MMNHPVPSPSEPPAAAPPRRAPSSGSGFAAPFLAGAAIFVAFLAYGRLAPTIFRATAQIVLEPVAGKPLALPRDPSPTERLRAAAVDDDSLAQTAALLGLGVGATAHAAAKQRTDTLLEVVAHGANAFDLSFRDATPEGAQRVANLLARHTAARAVRALGQPAPDQSAAREAARTKNAADLAMFMAAHPELAPPTVVPLAPKETPDRDGAGLRAERDQIQAKLARQPEANARSDNPFGDQSGQSAEAIRLRRRVAEIDQTLKTRQHAEPTNPSTVPKIAPDVEREWKRLMQAVANPVVDVQPAQQDFTVMLRDAALPVDPISPDRRRLGFFGAFAAILTMLIALLVQSLFRRGAAPQTGMWHSTWATSEPPRVPSEPPQFDNDPLRVPSEPPQFGNEPPRVPSEPPQFGGEPPRAASEPPQFGGEPPRLSSEAPFARTESAWPPLASGEPARASSNPPAAEAEAPQARSDPPQPIIAVGGTQIVRADQRVSSSYPAGPVAPARPSPSPAATAAAAPLSKPSPLPPVPSPSPARPTPGYEELRPPPDVRSKSTLVGMNPIDASGLGGGPFDAPGAPHDDGPRSTLRPPPLENSGTVASAGIFTTAGTATRPSGAPRAMIETSGIGSEEPAPARANELRARPLGPPEPDESWTGPSRAHRRSIPAARRTTQMLGSPIPPVVRGSRTPASEHATSTPVPGSPMTTGYSYVSSRPPGEIVRPPQDTPPYYQTTSGEPRRGSTPSPYGAASQPPVKRTRVTIHPARQGWAPDPALDFRSRRPLADQILPLAVEGCFVLGVTAVSESRTQKSRVAAELALALAESNHPRILLLEGDFQWPNVHQTMRLEMPIAAGFSQQLRGRASTKPDAWTVIECLPCLHVLGEGIMRSPGHILSVQFEESVRSLRTYYDLIVLDGPDTSAEGECRALANVIDGFVLVAPAVGSREIPRAVQLFPDKSFSLVLGV